MSVQAVLLPLFVQVVLTFVLLFWAGLGRIRAVRGGTVSSAQQRESDWPLHVARSSNAYRSQLQLPVLFYVLTILAWQTRQADLLFVIMAWAFVVLRLAHAFVHVTTSHLEQRAWLFITGALVLALMWLIFVLRILLAL